MSVLAEGVETTFFTLVAPLKLNGPVPQLRVLDYAAQKVRFEVTGVGQNSSEVDHVVWSEMAEPFVLGTLRGRARTAWWRASALGGGSVLHACEVETISCTSDRATELIADARPFRWVAWDEVHGLTQD